MAVHRKTLDKAIAAANKKLAEVPIAPPMTTTRQTAERNIWVMPGCGHIAGEDRCWSVDDLGECEECGEPCIEYVRADALLAERKAATAEVARLREALNKIADSRRIVHARHYAHDALAQLEKSNGPRDAPEAGSMTDDAKRFMESPFFPRGEWDAALSASNEACYKWPDDTPEHKAARAAYVDGFIGGLPARAATACFECNEPLGRLCPKCAAYREPRDGTLTPEQSLDADDAQAWDYGLRMARQITAVGTSNPRELAFTRAVQAGDRIMALVADRLLATKPPTQEGKP